MCENCLPHNLPASIKQGYAKRKWTFSVKRKKAGRIEHLILKKQVTKDGEPYWKGVELLRFDDDNRQELRFMYYARREKDKKWVWGQFCPMFPPETLEGILIEMKKHDWVDL